MIAQITWLLEKQNLQLCCVSKPYVHLGPVAQVTLMTTK